MSEQTTAKSRRKPLEPGCAGRNVSPEPARGNPTAGGGQNGSDPLALLARECDLADADMRKWVRVPVKYVRAALSAVVRASGATGCTLTDECTRCGRHETTAGCLRRLSTAGEWETVHPEEAVSGVTPGNPTREQVVDAILPSVIRYGERDYTYAQRMSSLAADAVLALFPSPAPGDQQADMENARLTLEHDLRYIRQIETERDACAQGLLNASDKLTDTTTELAALRAAITDLRTQAQPLTTVAAAWLDNRLTDALDGKP